MATVLELKDKSVTCEICKRSFKNVFSRGAHKPHCLGNGYKFSKTNCNWAKGKNSLIDARVKGPTFEQVFCEKSKVGRGYVKQSLFRLGLCENRCSECGVETIYNGKPITLELDHINGIRDDNRLENLRILCPNCHSQTPTFRSKNRSKKAVTDEQIIQAIEKARCMADVTTQLGLASNNTARIKRIMLKLSLSFPQKKHRVKHGDRRAYLAAKKRMTNARNAIKLEKLLSSGIDFSKFGWATKASKIIDISPQKVSWWMKQNALDFYNKNCFCRLGKKLP